MLARVISVGELNRLAKELLEGNLPLMWVVARSRISCERHPAIAIFAQRRASTGAL
jgi:hypothetical protein